MKRETRNPYDHEIDVEIVTVGCNPKRISSLTSVFIRRGGITKCVVNSSQRYLAGLVQGRIKIPCLLHFTAHTEKEARKTRDLVGSLPISEGEQYRCLLH